MEEKIKTMKELIETTVKFVLDTTPPEFKIEEVLKRIETTLYSVLDQPPGSFERSGTLTSSEKKNS